jgi:ECF transporter S component (folate family)
MDEGKRRGINSHPHYYKKSRISQNRGPMRKSSVYRLAIDAMMAALYFVLAFLVNINIMPNVHVTPASIAIILVAVLYSPADAVMVAVVGELINQVAKYGITLTTPLWLVPVVLRALIISVVAYLYRRGDKHLEDNIPAYLATLAVAAVVTTIANTYVIYIDAMLFKYPSGLTLAQTILRLASGVLTAVVMSIVSIPVLRAVRRLNIGRAPTRSEALARKMAREQKEEPTTEQTENN